jgi:single-strand DNA-binding protein
VIISENRFVGKEKDMYSLNRAQIVGNVTRDPEMRFTPNGRAVSSFGIATNRRWKNQDGSMQEDTQFHEIVAWGKLAEIVSQILKKGSKVYVEGRLQTRSWEGQDGAKRQKTEIVIDDFIALSPKGTISSTPDITSASRNIEEFPIKDTGDKTPKKSSAKSKKSEVTKTDDAKDDDKDEIDLDEIPF